MRHIAIALALALLTALPAAAELSLQTVRSDRIYYEPGSEAKFEVVVANPDDAEAKATLRVELVWDVGSRRTLAEQAITVPAKGQTPWTGTAKLPTVLGMGLTATLLRDGKPFAEKSDYFSCAHSVHQVLLFGRGNHHPMQFSGLVDPMRDTYPAEFAQQLRNTYGNCTEKFGWGPSDFDDLTPDGDRWWAGQTSYNECKTNMILVFKALHEQGIKAVTYGKEAAAGIVGFENYRRRPDLAAYNNGRPYLENYSAAYLDWITVLGPPHPGETRPVPGTPREMEEAGYPGSGWFEPFTPGGCNWCSVWYDCANSEIAEVGIRELVESAPMFGFDGVRFDGEFWAGRYQQLDGSYNVDAKADLEAMNVAVTQRMKKACWAVDPRYVFGYNAQLDVTWSIPLNNTSPTFREKCKDDGLVANEAMAFPGDVPWTQYLKAIRRDAEIVRYYGGHYSTYGFNRAGVNLYNFIGQYALRAHQMTYYQGSGADWLNRSVTRFSRLLWDDSLNTWRGAGSTLQLSGTRPLWCQELAAVGDAPEGGTRYVIHLINPPDSPTTFGERQMPAGPAANVTVRWKGLTGFRSAWVVDMQATTVEAVKPVNGAFNVGNVPFWKILVVDVTAPKPPVTWEAPPSGPATGPSATDLQIAPSAASSSDSWRTVTEPERWGGGEDVAQRVPDPTASAGGAVMGTPTSKTGGMAYTYIYPRIPGRYRSTFRLKVADNKSDAPVFLLGSMMQTPAPYAGLTRTWMESKTLKGTDFGKPNVYQTFTIEFDFADYGFLGSGASYLGNIQGWWDNMIVELVRPWTDQELADYYKNFTRPEGLVRTDNGALDVLLVRGLFNRQYQLDAAVQALPNVKQLDAYSSFNGQAGNEIAGYKWDWQPMWDLDVVVLADVETKGLNYGQVLMLSEWVKDGGGLLILGGPLTLGQDDNMKRAWPLLLPVDLKGPWEIRKCAPPVQVAGFAGNASVMYRHMVAPKAGATVLLKGAGDEPLLVGQSYGKGKVAVFTGTVLGEAPAGSKAFWETDQWKQELAKAMSWVAGK